MEIVKNNKGFTLVELLVVISIMAILTVITVSQFGTARKKARDVQRKGDLSSLMKALLMYYTDHGVFPVSNNGMIEVNGSTVTWGESFTDKDGYVFMIKTPKENYLSDLPYCYKVDSNLKKAAVFAMLENTVDSECDRNNNGVADDNTYICNGENYCYARVSPNSSLNSNGDLQ